jgi:hypothetical protein
MNRCNDLLTLSNPHPNLPPLTEEGAKRGRGHKQLAISIQLSINRVERYSNKPKGLL